ncbi:hypothetical protein AL552_21520 [Vibrio diabolicus]|uniref:Uncharacterized protein n=2 Tax=Vibrio TaxID=662 RepID=A0AAX1XM28_9VIBR|nr:hypothetical protein AL537_01695 [Vibrio diabolicus]MDU9593083.1 hypothetical protein [Vibrio sp. 2-1-2a]MDU9604835.1 hypothetical protein [Vibrio sp. 1-2-3a]MPS37138.1 hypothetical protein [Vibrio sp. VGrn 2]NKJ68901.1 hypothetical protein [Vibrio chemaguriensis]NNN58738.1 hypothetical protein [Vibrio sp. 1-2 (7-a)]NNN81747.1 hypothetical protein [Vibrio sp. 11-4(1)]PLX59286.1 MAG: hypothetical protein C0632_13900 [Vibrio alginolyticus]
MVGGHKASVYAQVKELTWTVLVKPHEYNN